MLVKCPQCGFEKNCESQNGATICPKCHKRFVFSWKLRKDYYKALFKTNPAYHEKNKEYRKLWRRTHNEKENLRDRETYKFYANALKNHFGDKCFVCGKVRQNERFDLHEKQGQNHKKRRRYVYENKEHFVLLCKQCHIAVHWNMRHLHIKWEDMFP